jgi:four helix bundle protein
MRLAGTNPAMPFDMTPQELRDRTKRFAIAIVRLTRDVPRDWNVRVIGGQLLKSGTAVAANYRSSCRARSDREFCAKIGVVVEESDESQLWLELLVEARPQVRNREFDRLVDEASQLTAIFTASHQTAKKNLRKKAEERARKRVPKPR